MIIVVITALAEVGGYIALVWMIKNTGDASLYSAYVAFQCLVVLSPNILQAAAYSTVGKISIVAKMDKKSSWLKPKVISWGFVLFDLVCLIVQAVGISIWASEKSTGEPNVSVVKLGSWITVAGLGMQLVSFLAFTILSVWIQRHKDNKFKSHRAHGVLFAGVYGVILLISIRNIFRFVEFVQGAIRYPDPGGISEDQTLFYCLETLPIALSFGVFILLGPIAFLPKGNLEEFIPDVQDSSNKNELEKHQDIGEELVKAENGTNSEFEAVRLDSS